MELLLYLIIGNLVKKMPVFFDKNTSELIVPAPEIRGFQCYDQVYYFGDELTIFAVTTGLDFGFVLDPTSGHIFRNYETR